MIDNVTFWNLGDKDSWLGVNNHPLPFDVNYKPKRSYFVIKNFDAAMDNITPKEDFRPNVLNQPWWTWRHRTAQRQGRRMGRHN